MDGLKFFEIIVYSYSLSAPHYKADAGFCCSADLAPF